MRSLIKSSPLRRPKRSRRLKVSVTQNSIPRAYGEAATMAFWFGV